MVFNIVFDAGLVVLFPLVVELVPDHAKFVEDGYTFVGEVVAFAAAASCDAEVGYPASEVYTVFRNVVCFYVYVSVFIFIFAERSVVFVPGAVVFALPFHAYGVEFRYSVFGENSGYFAGSYLSLCAEP